VLYYQAVFFLLVFKNEYAVGIFCLFLGCSQTVVWGQTINGKIIDDKQLPIDGATIILQVVLSSGILSVGF